MDLGSHYENCDTAQNIRSKERANYWHHFRFLEPNTTQVMILWRAQIFGRLCLRNTQNQWRVILLINLMIIFGAVPLVTLKVIWKPIGLHIMKVWIILSRVLWYTFKWNWHRNLRNFNLNLNIPCKYSTEHVVCQHQMHLNTARHLLFAGGGLRITRVTAPTSSRLERRHYFVYHQVSVSLPNHYQWPPH